MSFERSVPFFNYKVFQNQYGEKLNKIIQDVMNRGAFILQKDLEEFENNIAKYLGVKHAIGVANCTDGLEMALMAAGIKAGDEVILPSHTFIATAAAVKTAGATRILVECGCDHMMDVASFESAITNKTRAVMPVQLNGRTCDMDAILAIAKKHQLIVIEDAAQALGSMYKNKKAGTFGLAAAFSFYPAKVLGCLGDGGIVVTNDDEMADKVYRLHEHGRSKAGDIGCWGRNSRLDNLQAAILNEILKDYDHIISRRREIAAMYQEELGCLKQLHLPPAPNADSNHFDVYQNYEIEADKRDALQLYLKENGIGTLQQWSGRAVHQHEELGFDHVKLPITDKMTSRYLMIPMNMSLTNDDIKYVSVKIRQFFC
jgi:dTDP-4-amino-4,6-dideoxygalactose transaminase